MRHSHSECIVFGLKLDTSAPDLTIANADMLSSMYTAEGRCTAVMRRFPLQMHAAQHEAL